MTIAAADGLPRQAGRRPARQDRHALLGGDPDGGDDVVGRPRHDDAERLDLVEAGVGGVEPAPAPVEIDLGAGLLGQAVAKAVQGERRESVVGGHVGARSTAGSGCGSIQNSTLLGIVLE